LATRASQRSAASANAARALASAIQTQERSGAAASLGADVDLEPCLVGGWNAPGVVCSGAGVVSGGAGVVPWPFNGNSCHSSVGGFEAARAADASTAVPSTPTASEQQRRTLRCRRDPRVRRWRRIVCDDRSAENALFGSLLI
jgi:hypothetical protein